MRALLERARKLTAVLRLRAFDTASAEGRAQERYRRAALSALASAFSSGLSFLIGLISVPLTLGYLGRDRYGLWMTMSSLVAMFGFADLGMGNGLINALSEANGRNDREVARRYVSSAIMVIVVLTFVVAAALAAAYPFVPWSRIFNVSSPEATAEAAPATAVLFGCFLIGLPLALISRVQTAYQEGFTASLWGSLGSVLMLGGLVLVIRLRAGLPWLVLVFGAAPLIAYAFNGIALFYVQRPWLRPTWREATLRVGMRLVRLGLLFVVLQITVALTYSSDNVVIAQVLGPQAVTEYAVPAKLFNLVPVLLTTVLGPLWPAYGESIARGDIDWVKRTLIGSTLMSVALSIVICAVLVAFGNPVLRFWTRQEMNAPLSLMLGLGVWTVINAAGTAVAMFLNGAHVVRFQVIIASITGVVAFPGKFLLTRYIGIAGPIWMTIVCYVLFAGLPMAYQVPRLLAEVANKQTVRGVA